MKNLSKVKIAVQKEFARISPTCEFNDKGSCGKYFKPVTCNAEECPRAMPKPRGPTSRPIVARPHDNGGFGELK